MAPDTGSKMDSGQAKRLKVIGMLSLTIQNAILGLSMRYARTRQGPMFFQATAVCLAECFKLALCLVFVFYENQRDWSKYLSNLHSTIWLNKWDTFKVCVPSMIYLVQNNLLYVAAQHLDVTTYQITYQLKLLTTALFTVLILKRKVPWMKWASLLVLVGGIAMVQLSDSKETFTSSVEQNRSWGFLAALTACFSSGLAGVYFEKILKGSDVSVWMRNIQLAIFAIPAGLILALYNHSDSIGEKGFFYGYDLFVWYLVALNGIGGLLVAMVVKYADNILKGFACSMAIIITCIISVFVFGFTLSAQFLVGACLVLISVVTYSYEPAVVKAKPEVA